MILFLCDDDIWSMGKNKGVSSLHRLIEAVKTKETVKVFTSGAPVFRLSNRYLAFIYGFFSYLFTNVKYVLYLISTKDIPRVIYVSSPLPSLAGKFLSVYYHRPYIQRLYGGFLYQKLGHKYEMLKSYQEFLAFKCNATRYVITDDGSSMDKVAKYFSIPDKKVLFLINGVDRQDVSLKKKMKEKVYKIYNIPENAFLIISVSRLVFNKGVDRIILTMNKLVSNKDIYYLVLGDGDQRKHYESISKNENTIFVGAKTNAEVTEYYLAADLFVSMYRRTNLGNPLLEAMSAGVPIITINNGETNKIYNGNNMILLNQKDDIGLVNDLSAMIIKVKFDNEFREKLEIAAKEYADNNLLSWEERINIETEELYKLARSSNDC